MRRCLLIILPILLALALFADSGQSPDPLVIKAWRIADGLPHNSIMALTQTSDGYLWLGTPNGLVRFNGRQFRIFNRWNTPVFKDHRIVSLMEDDAGVLWVGTQAGGIILHSGGALRRLEVPESINLEYLTCIAGDDNGAVWIGTRSGLIHRNSSSEWEMYTITDGLNDNTVTAVIPGAKDILWVGSETGLSRGVKTADRNRYVFHTLISEWVHCLIQEPGGADIWCGTAQRLIKIPGDSLTADISSSMVFDTAVTDLIFDHKHHLWIGTFGNGLSRLTDAGRTDLSVINGLSDDFIHCILEDREGNIWTGTYAGGLIRIKDARFHAFGRETGLPEDPVGPLLGTDGDILLVGTPHRGLVGLSFREPTARVTFSMLQNNGIACLAPLPTGNILAGTSRGIFTIDLYNTESTVRLTGPFEDQAIQSIQSLADGTIYVGTRDGMYVGYQKRWVKRRELEDTVVRAFFYSHNHILWIGTNMGLYQLKNGAINIIPLDQSTTRQYDILTLNQPPGSIDTLCIGTNGEGMIIRTERGSTRLTEESGLPDNFILSILFADPVPTPGVEPAAYPEDYSAWISTYKGVVHLSGREIQDITQGTIAEINPVIHDESDGMRSSECRGMVQPAAFRADTGVLYFPTTGGISSVNPAEITINRVPPPVILEDIVADGRSVSPENPVYLPAKTQLIEIYFAALSLTSPEKIRYRYRLIGYDADWINLAPDSPPNVLYYNLEPGDYEFRVIASNNDGVWNPDGTGFRFIIRSSSASYLFIPVVILLSLAAWFFMGKRIPKSRRRSPADKYRTSALSEERSGEILNKLDDLMRNQKVFLDPALTLKKLSEVIMVHPNHISQTINQKHGKSFNDFINEYRIAAAREILGDPARKEMTILEIAYEVGFYSKSVFNTAFKKFSGCTPSQFRNQPTKDCQ